MSNVETIEQELRKYVDDSENLSNQDRYVYLKAIFDKHLAMEKTQHLLTMSEFQEIISNAKSRMAEAILPMSISRKKVDSNDVRIVAMTEAILMYLNRSKLLRKFIKIDYTIKT